METANYSKKLTTEATGFTEKKCKLLIVKQSVNSVISVASVVIFSMVNRYVLI